MARKYANNTPALREMLCKPCATCGTEPDNRVWISRYSDGGFISECGDCFDKREGVIEITGGIRKDAKGDAS